MTKKTALDIFRSELQNFPLRNDKVAIREAWGIFTDRLCKDRFITMKQYETWTSPF